MAPPVDLTKLDASQFKKFLDSFDYVFSDCDGVIWVQRTPLPGSGETLQLLKKLKKTVKYVSNNSLRTAESYRKLFTSAGIEDGYEHLTIPSTAMADYLKSVNFSKKIYCISCPQTMKVFEDSGFKCVYGPDIIPDHYLDFGEFLKDDPEIGAVVCDSDYKVNLPKMYRAVTYLGRADVLFLNGATDREVPLNVGQTAIGPGVFSDIIAEKVNRFPIQLGKPGKEFGELAMRKAGATDPARVLFIGDMIEQDIGLGKAAGFQTLLVLTTFSVDDMMSNKIQPDYYSPTLGSLLPQLKSQ